MELKVTFKNWQQRAFYYSTARNECFSGGFNNGKTFILCLKSLVLLMTYANYRVIIARQTYKDLKQTTMQTFLAMCPTEMIQSHNEQDGLTQLSNGSLIYWMHLDGVDENSLRGIEPNSIFVDQGEEVLEAVFLALDSRVGRWAHALVPQYLLDQYPNWPYKNDRPVAPSYMCIGCNPDDEFHFIYRNYHPDSPARRLDYFYVEAEWDANLGSEETYQQALGRDDEWVDKYVKGKWGSSRSSIHRIHHDSILEPSESLLEIIKTKGNLFRVLDHGDSAPTACGWVAVLNGVYIFYREYYVANKVISYHRKAISSLSVGESYSNDYADPQIFKKTAQKAGTNQVSIRWSVAEEYYDKSLDAPELFWQPADNNEFATRNRINELLTPSRRFQHPITKESPAPGLYFVKAVDDPGPDLQNPHCIYPQGCREIIRQTGAQRKKLLGTLDGKSIYSDDRDDAIPDHAYDVVRYFVAMHGTSPVESRKAPSRNSFAYYNAVLKQKLLYSGRV